jgi:hypothetical protein
VKCQRRGSASAILDSKLVSIHRNGLDGEAFGAVRVPRGTREVRGNEMVGDEAIGHEAPKDCKVESRAGCCARSGGPS